MKKWKLLCYRAALRALPPPSWAASAAVVAGDCPPALARGLVRILRRQRAVGASLALFDRAGVTASLCCGDAVRGSLRVTPDTFFRAASIAKLVTAMAVFRLSEAAQVDLDADVDRFLPCSLRHPAAPDLPVTLQRLLTHTAGLRDGAGYADACRAPVPLPELMRRDVFAPAPDAFVYSNLGFGLVACVLEGMLGKAFETIMQTALFQPLGVQAGFYPQAVAGDIANAYRVLPPRRAPLLDNALRRARPLPEEAPDPARHYLFSQGNLYITAPSLARLGSALMQPRYAPMRRKAAAFGTRDPSLSMGLGTFILEDRDLSPRPLYGHQGLAYGAMHGVFFDPVAGRGVALLTSGAGTARRYVLSDLNRMIIRQVFSCPNE